MPSTLDSSVKDILVPILDDVRTVVASVVGNRAWRVYRVVRTWSGGEPGSGTATDVATEITPIPVTTEMDKLRRRQEPQGLEEAGMVELSLITLNYLESELRPTPAANAELLYKLTDAHGQGQADRWFTIAAGPTPDRKGSPGWLMTLRKAEQ